jgi:L-lysine exporter family protein LysE/ArgO
MSAIAFTQGFALSLGLIAAVGPQNLHVLTTGLRRAHVGTVVALCVAADVALIAAGALGVGASLAQAPRLAAVLQWVAAAFLALYAWRSWRELRRAAALPPSQAAARASRRSAVVATLVVTFGNPSVYLETLMLLGATAAGLEPASRAWFAAGAMSASACWFGALGWGARHLAPWLARPRAWQLVHGASAASMLHLALQLVGDDAGTALMAGLRLAFA